MKYGGWGIRYNMDGSWAYTLAGDSKQVVEIVWTERGKTKKLVVSSLTPTALASSIQAAQMKAPQWLRASSVVASLPSSSQEELEEQEAREEVWEKALRR